VANFARTFVVILTLMVVQACVGNKAGSPGPTPRRDVDYKISWVDDPAHRNFAVRLEPLNRGEMCTGPGQWPNATGHLGGSGLKITTRVDGKLFTYRDSNMEMCLLRMCENPISRGSVLQSILTYDEFQLPEELWSATKELYFDPEPYWCNKRR
jgi:hypothetical protein